MALKHINLIGQAIYIVTLKHHGLGRPEEMIRHDQRTAAAMYYCMQLLTAVGLCLMIINNSVVFTKIFIIFGKGTLIILNQMHKYFLPFMHRRERGWSFMRGPSYPLETV